MNYKKIFYKILRNPNFILREFKKRMVYKNLISFKKGKGFPLMDVYLMFTADCNLNCKMCNAPRREEKLFQNYILKWKKNQLTVKDYKRLIDDLTRVSAEITLTGGEPLIRQDWYEVAQYVKSKNLNLNLQTNGLKLKEYAKDIIEVVDVLNVSIDGPEEIHDRIRGKKGIFNKILEGISEISELKKEKNKKKPEIVIAYTVCEDNFAYLTETVKYLVKKDIEFSGIVFQHLLFTNKETIIKYQDLVGDNRETDLWLASIYSPVGLDCRRLVEEIEDLKRWNYNDIWISFVPELNPEEVENWYIKPDFIAKKFSHPCYTPWMDVDICPDGDVRICIDYSIGNIKEDSILNIWQGEKAQKLRKDIIKRAPYPVCRACCNLYRY